MDQSQSPKLIIALDFSSRKQVLNLVDRLDPSLCALKVGNELFTSFGPEFIKHLLDKQFKIFLDLKFHDIPNTVAKACKAAADLGVWMMNIHTSGGFPMMEAASSALVEYGQTKPLLVGVTVLTSFNAVELMRVGISKPLEDQVRDLALLGKAAGLDGVVCSALEVSFIKTHCGADFLTVTPGIRMEGQAPNDQSRVMTPKQAFAAGSDYLVIGRPITQAPDPYRALLDTLASF